MQDFFENVSRYPRYLISFSLGIFFAFAERIRPLFKNPVTGFAVVGMLLGSFSLIFFTLRAMLGLA